MTKYDERVLARAIILDDEIDVATISTTRRAAIVNWLVVNAGCLILNSTTDDEIETLWQRHGGSAFVATVEISRALPEV